MYEDRKIILTEMDMKGVKNQWFRYLWVDVFV